MSDKSKAELIQILIKQFHQRLDQTVLLLSSKLLWDFYINYVAKNESDRFTVQVQDKETNSIVMNISLDIKSLREMQLIRDNETRRSYLNDLYNLMCRYNICIDSILRSLPYQTPEHYDGDIDAAIQLINRYLSKEDKKFLEFYRRLRNSVVHYDGNHNKKNGLDYIFQGVHFLSSDTNIGTQIIFSHTGLRELYSRIKMIYSCDNLFRNQLFQNRLNQ